MGLASTLIHFNSGSVPKRGGKTWMRLPDKLMVLRAQREAKEDGRVLRSLLERSREWRVWYLRGGKQPSSTHSIALSCMSNSSRLLSSFRFGKLAIRFVCRFNVFKEGSSPSCKDAAGGVWIALNERSRNVRLVMKEMHEGRAESELWEMLKCTRRERFWERMRVSWTGREEILL